MRRGQHLEPAIAEWWSDEHGIALYEPDVLYVRGDGWRRSTGASSATTPKPSRSRRRPSYVNRPERYWWWQCQAQMYCADLERVHLAVLDASMRLATYVVERDEEAIDRLVERADEVMAYVDVGEWPPTVPDAPSRCRHTDRVVELDADAAEHLDAWLAAAGPAARARGARGRPQGRARRAARRRPGRHDRRPPGAHLPHRTPARTSTSPGCARSTPTSPPSCPSSRSCECCARRGRREPHHQARSERTPPRPPSFKRSLDCLRPALTPSLPLRLPNPLLPPPATSRPLPPPFPTSSSLLSQTTALPLLPSPSPPLFLALLSPTGGDTVVLEDSGRGDVRRLLG